MKRCFDLVAALLLLLLTSPFLLAAMLCIRLTMGSPVLFVQLRPGLHGRPFHLYKLRTMSDAHASDGNLLPDGQRLTSAGKWLRRLSLDELPQLLNVVKGDMSFVGPRPLLMEYMPLYDAQQARRHEVLPGITGWAQVNGRNAISWEERFALDIWYVDHASFWLDMKILWLTLMHVISGRGVSAEGHATMPKFTGSRSSGGDE